MKKLKQCKAFSIIELLIVMVILGILLLVIPNLELFYLSAVKKEGVQLVRAIIEQERVYRADNGEYYMAGAGDNAKKKSIQNWKTIKTLLIDNKYFKADAENGGNIEYGDDGSGSDGKFNKVIQSVSNKTCSDDECRLEVVVKANPKSRAKGWLIQGHLIEGKNVTNNKNEIVTNKIVFKEAFKEDDDNVSNSEWQEISL